MYTKEIFSKITQVLANSNVKCSLPHYTKTKETPKTLQVKTGLVVICKNF